MTSTIDLSGLRDIIEPIRPDFFPPAIGWWIVILGGILIILMLIFFGIHHYYAPLPYALRELKKHRSESTPVSFAKEASKLLKRAAILKFGAEKVATLSDDTWYRFLSAQAHQKITSKVIKLIAFSAYLPDNKSQDVSPQHIYEATRLLLKNILKDKKNECHNPK